MAQRLRYISPIKVVVHLFSHITKKIPFYNNDQTHRNPRNRGRRCSLHQARQWSHPFVSDRSSLLPVITAFRQDFVFTDESESQMQFDANLRLTKHRPLVGVQAKWEGTRIDILHVLRCLAGACRTNIRFKALENLFKEFRVDLMMLTTQLQRPKWRISQVPSERPDTAYG